MRPKRIQRKRVKGWTMPEGAVYVGRPSGWANPFQVGGIMTRLGSPNLKVEITSALAGELFRAWLDSQGWKDDIPAELAGRDLVCWCPLDQPCHADVLLEVANR